MKQKALPALLACAACCVVVNPSNADEEHSDLEIGRDGNQLVLVAGGDDPIFLEPAIGLLTGWSAAEPGIFEIQSPELGFDPLNTFTNTGINLELVSADAGFFFLAAGSFTPINTPGQSAALGLESGLVHSHPTWVIDSEIVGPTFAGSRSATFIFTDTNNNYTDSAPFTLTFTNVPEPSSLALLGLGGLALMRRRR